MSRFSKLLDGWDSLEEQIVELWGACDAVWDTTHMPPTFTGHQWGALGLLEQPFENEERRPRANANARRSRREHRNR
jgi:hypothetical protein